MKKILLLIATTVLAGCSTPYPCGEPNSGNCRSVTTNYKGSYTGGLNPDDLPNSSANPSSSPTTSSTEPVPFINFKTYSQVPANNAPLISQPKMLRVWLTSYTDTDNIYHDQGYEYIIVNHGKWNYSNNKTLIDDDTPDVTMGQVSSSRTGGYGAFGLLDTPPPPPKATNPTPQFPAINSLQGGIAPQVITQTAGSGIDRTTQIMP